MNLYYYYPQSVQYPVYKHFHSLVPLRRWVRPRPLFGGPLVYDSPLSIFPPSRRPESLAQPPPSLARAPFAKPGHFVTASSQPPGQDVSDREVKRGPPIPPLGVFIPPIRSRPGLQLDFKIQCGAL
jgi:hypothetical protein